MDMGWLARRSVTRVALWCALFATCPAVAVTAALRPAWVFLAALCGTATVWVPSAVLLRDRPPMHRCAPRHARGGHVGSDTDTKLRVADLERELRAHRKFWQAIGLAPTEPRPRKWHPKLIKGDDDQEGDPGTKAGLAGAALVLVG